VPLDWEKALAIVAFTFHFPLSELWALDREDLRFWTEKAIEIGESRG
jgi:hypothetical protein